MPRAEQPNNVPSLPAGSESRVGPCDDPAVSPSDAGLRVLVIDVGGSHVKCLATGQSRRRRFDSGDAMTPARMVEGVRALVHDWPYDVVAIGYPGVVRDGTVFREPVNLGRGWVGFDFARAFGCPVRVVNDAAMQALGSYRRGTMLFLGLGTGLGSALIVDGVLVPMELGHLHRTWKSDYEDLLGKRGYRRLGKKKWRRKVHAVVQGFRDALLPDEVVIGGGQAERLQHLPPQTRRCGNEAAFEGGFRLWGESTSPSMHHEDRATPAAPVTR